MLRKLCGTFETVPRTCLIDEDFKTQEETPFATRGYTDLWERYWNERRVAVKALRFSPDDDQSKITKVRVLFLDSSLRGVLLSLLEILQRSGIVETPKSPQRSSVLRSFVESEPVLYCFPMDGEWQHPQLHEEEPGGQ